MEGATLMKTNKNDYTIVAYELITELVNNITGNDEDWLFGKVPSQNVMIGMIDGEKKEEAVNRGEEVDNKRFDYIPSIGLRFRVPTHAKSLEISLSGKLFYRQRPTHKEQIKYLLKKYSNKYNMCFETVQELLKHLNDTMEDFEKDEPKEGIVNVYKSIQLNELGLFEFDIFNFDESLINLNKEIKIRLEKVVDNIKNSSFGYKNVLRKISSLLDEITFESIISSSESMAVPNWDIEIYSSIEYYEKYNEIVIQLINNTNKIAIPNSYETAIFNGGLKIKSEEYIPISFNSLKHYYVDNPQQYAIGNNCSVKKTDNVLETESMPIYVQNRVITIDKFNHFIEFQKLIDNPIDNLMHIHNEMSKRLVLYKREVLDAKSKFSEDYIRDFEFEVNDFEHEINRFHYGINLLKNKTDVRNAFNLMNKTFALNPKYNGWRMFQIVFIVSELADMIYCEYKNTPGF